VIVAFVVANDRRFSDRNLGFRTADASITRRRALPRFSDGLSTAGALGFDRFEGRKARRGDDASRHRASPPPTSYASWTPADVRWARPAFRWPGPDDVVTEGLLSPSGSHCGCPLAHARLHCGTCRGTGASRCERSALTPRDSDTARSSAPRPTLGCAVRLDRLGCRRQIADLYPLDRGRSRRPAVLTGSLMKTWVLSPCRWTLYAPPGAPARKRSSPSRRAGSP
jgi:hypothetical protein